MRETESDTDNERLTRLPSPSPYHITDPFQERGLWCFWLSADDEVLRYIADLSCILHASNGSPFQRRLQGRVKFAFNPRYDHEEAWLWINEILESETNAVDLHDTWEAAIDDAQETSSND